MNAKPNDELSVESSASSRKRARPVEEDKQASPDVMDSAADPFSEAASSLQSESIPTVTEQQALTSAGHGTQSHDVTLLRSLGREAYAQLMRDQAKTLTKEQLTQQRLQRKLMKQQHKERRQRDLAQKPPKERRTDLRKLRSSLNAGASATPSSMDLEAGATDVRNDTPEDPTSMPQGPCAVLKDVAQDVPVRCAPPRKRILVERKRGDGSADVSTRRAAGGEAKDDDITAEPDGDAGSGLPLEAAEVFMFDNQRHVRPYYFTFTSIAKQRWYGRSVLDVFSSEFVRYSKDYYARAISAGRLTLNGQQVSASTVIRNGDAIAHSVHRHEPPVTAQPIRIVHETDEVIIIDKPATLPLHPCGRYRHQSVTAMLHRDLGKVVYIIHRLDRQTSGLVLLAKSSSVASRYSEEMRQMKFEKVYVARVLGEFPTAPDIVVDAPISCVDKLYSEYGVDPAGKVAKTIFRRLSFNGHTSVVQCVPVTGRTHQIRVHLKHLGYPIANDPCYGGKLFKSNSVSGKKAADEVTAEYRKAFDDLQILQDLNDPDCAECKVGSYWADDRRYCTHIWLHAVRYFSAHWDYQVPLPAWAEESFDSRGACAIPVEHLRTRI